MLNQEFVSNGFKFIKANFYLNQKNTPSLQQLEKIFDQQLANDGYEFRQRAYLKLQWCRRSNAITVATNQHYFQTASSNSADGGKIRQFKRMGAFVLEIPVVKDILQQNLALIREYQSLQTQQQLTIGLHFIRYQAAENSASYSSPAWLHKDDEPLVFVHLVNLSKTALGGDNLIASNNQEITHVLRLENALDTLVLNKNVYHAVTPLGSKNGTAQRDIILFTVEPNHTQLS